jgi:hypothetical protein
LVPEAHEVEHVVHDVQDPTQEIGHVSLVQVRVSVVVAELAQAVPPLAAATTMPYLRASTPLPQVTEQVPHCVHAPMQFTGHAPVLHDAVSVSPWSASQCSPEPACATATVNVLDCEPTPHVRLQLVHALQEPWQVTGHTTAWPEESVGVHVSTSPVPCA